MDLETINNGRIANDGTGDTPRDAWGKQNRNNAKLKAAAQTALDAAGAVVGGAAAATAAAAAAQAVLNGGVVPASMAPRRLQFLDALEASGAGRVATLAAAVPSDPGDPVNRAYQHTLFVTASCRLAVFARATLGLTDAAFAAILDAARTLQD
ncbi:hypothetical protein OPKNFCMD_3824 [Methylobacterium crusticola]|uniref:Uncharacterized protein n=1 Tax=Methylobacterium crusticola TaxID=1697972 RepID=A0ABQ4R0F0_9HYPH|nr:hypothetical protein [Methylobacterium crusticola]GJD51073.1 hypothetical protein OPKNFCMD_3824 [Methylobacterium crusticola]